MVDVLKALLASPHGVVLFFVTILILTGLLLLVMRLMWLAVGRGSEVHFLGFKISPKSVNPQEQIKGLAPPAQLLPSEKIVYVKLLHMREKSDSKKPVYRYRFGDGEECDVWDEALYLFYHSFPEQQQSFRWNIRSSGIAHPNLLHPWMDRIEFPDPAEHPYGPLVAPICYVPSHVYIPVSHLFNGQQPGNREVLLLAESEVKFARLILDASSLPEMKLTHVQAFRGARPGDKRSIGSSEPRPGVFVCEGANLKPGETLRFTYEATPK